MEAAGNLAPPPGPALALPDGRRHLDSATYRTLACIFSRCLHLHPPHRSPRENTKLSSDSDGDSVSGKDVGVPKGAQSTEAAEKCLKISEGDLGLAGEQVASAIQSFAQLENDGSGSVDCLLNDLEAELHKEGELDGLQNTLLSDFVELLDGLVDGATERPPESTATICELDIVKMDVTQDLHDAPGSAVSDIPDDIKAQNNEELTEEFLVQEQQFYCEPPTEKCSEQIRAVENESGASSDPLLVTTLLNLGEKQMSSLEGNLGDEGAEEGEISNEFQILDDFLDSSSENSDTENQDSEERLGEGGQEENEFDDSLSGGRYLSRHDPGDTVDLVLEDNGNLGTLPEKNAKCKSVYGPSILLKDSLMGQAIENDGNQDAAKDNDVCRKKVRGRITEEKKAKKKMARKRKRAQMDREQGVKRLKLQSIAKPKLVKHCNYYLKGRCQHGDKCKFSHDIIPLTKSQPCVYFARDICLKGEDCPFDHELSKYPCHKYAQGTCNRGDKCKFSHKVPESSAASPIAPNIETSLSSVKSNMGSKPDKKNPSLPKLAGGLPMSVQLSNLRHPEANSTEGSKKPPIKIPSGIRLLSFGGGFPTCSIKHQCSRAIEDIKTDNQNAFKSQKSTSGEPNIKAPFALDPKASSEIAVSSSERPQTELSDACKILDEFLFGIGG